MHKLIPIQEKILPDQQLERWLAIMRFKRKRIVFTNGCFDILHRGHIQYLIKAAGMGDVLIIGLNSDASVKKLKGPSRPYLDEDSRALILASLSFVTAVILFNEDTPYELIRRIQPDFLVKGGEYKPEEIVGYDIVKAKGGEVVSVDMVEGFSSTSIISKITGKP